MTTLDVMYICFLKYHRNFQMTLFKDVFVWRRMSNDDSGTEVKNYTSFKDITDIYRKSETTKLIVYGYFLQNP